MLEKIKTFIAHAKEEVVVPRWTIYLDAVIIVLATISAIV